MVIKQRKYVYGFVLLIGVVVVGWLFLLKREHAVKTSSNNSTGKSVQTPMNKNYPVRLKIPKIYVDAAIETVGITESGALGVPQNIMNVGWYQFGSVPGTRGSAVMDGHVDGKNGEAGIFALLHTLRIGDSLSIIDQNGKLMTFTVTSTKIVAAKEDTADIFNQSDGSHLNLITCFGDWDKSEQSYAKRLVVYADLWVEK